MMRNIVLIWKESRVIPWLFSLSWEQRKLGEIAEIVGGGTPSTSNPSYWDGDIDWYAPAEMEGQRYAVGSVRKITEAGLQNSSAKILPAHKTVLFTSRAGIGKMAILKLPGATNQGFQSLILKDGYNPYFIYSMGEEIKAKAEGVASGSTFLEISGKMLGNIEISIPRKAEQDAIAVYFERLDDLITLHHRQEKRSGHNPFQMQRRITFTWEQRKVGDILSDVERPIAMLDDETYQLVTVKRRNEGIVSRGYLKGKDILVKNYYRIHAGDFLISKRQVIHGANGYVPKSLDNAVVSNEYMVAVSNNDISTAFWALMSQRKEMYQMYLFSSYGVDVEKMVFNVDDWKKRSVIIPKLEEQTVIVSFFSKLDNLITLHQRELERLQNIKKSCLEKMFV